MTNQRLIIVPNTSGSRFGGKNLTTGKVRNSRLIFNFTARPESFRDSLMSYGSCLRQIRRGEQLDPVYATGLFNQKGFTLVEIALAMVILTVGILALLATITPSLYSEQTSREFDLAKTAAANKLEEIRGYDFATVYATYNNTYFAVTGLTAPATQTNPGFINIDNSNPNLLDITVTITWQSGIQKNTNLSVSMKTMLTKTM